MTERSEGQTANAAVAADETPSAEGREEAQEVVEELKEREDQIEGDDSEE